MGTVRGKDAFDAAARPCGVFDPPIAMIGRFEGRRQFDVRRSMIAEIRLRRSCTGSENAIVESDQRKLTMTRKRTAKTSAMCSTHSSRPEAQHAYHEAGLRAVAVRGSSQACIA